MIPNSQGVIDQHRLWIAFANVIYSVCVYFFLTKANIDFLHYIPDHSEGASLNANAERATR
jgi:hypothetical protein